MDPRHAQRIKTVQNLFSYSYSHTLDTIPHKGDPKTQKILNFLKEIDNLIQTYAAKFPTDKIARTDLSILRLGVYEMTIEKKLPEKVVIDEAVELAKELSGEKSYAFVNAVLGKILNHIQHEKTR